MHNNILHELWKWNLDLYTIIDQECNRQMHSLPEAEVIEWLMTHGYTFEEAMELKRDLKGDCIWGCWN